MAETDEDPSATGVLSIALTTTLPKIGYVQVDFTDGSRMLMTEAQYCALSTGRLLYRDRVTTLRVNLRGSREVVLDAPTESVWVSYREGDTMVFEEWHPGTS